MVFLHTVMSAAMEEPGSSTRRRLDSAWDEHRAKLVVVRASTGHHHAAARRRRAQPWASTRVDERPRGGATFSSGHHEWTLAAAPFILVAG
jgi:hypothetical protein